MAARRDQVAAGLGKTSPDGLSPGEQLRAIRPVVEKLLERHGRVFLHDIGPGLSEAGIVLCDWESLDDDDRRSV